MPYMRHKARQKKEKVINMAWNLGLQPEDTNLFRLLEENERRARKAYLRKAMPLITEEGLEGFL